MSDDEPRRCPRCDAHVPPTRYRDPERDRRGRPRTYCSTDCATDAHLDQARARRARARVERLRAELAGLTGQAPGQAEAA